jgi:hypothetical protein
MIVESIYDHPTGLWGNIQIGAQTRASHGDDIPIGGPGGWLQIFAGPRREVEGLTGFVDNHEGRRKMLDDGVGGTPQGVGSLQKAAIILLGPRCLSAHLR